MKPISFAPATHEVELRGVRLVFRVPAALETQQLTRLRRIFKDAYDQGHDESVDFYATSALVCAYLWSPTPELGALDTVLPVLPADIDALRDAASQALAELSAAGFTLEDLATLALQLEQRINGTDALRALTATADFTGARRG